MNLQSELGRYIQVAFANQREFKYKFADQYSNWDLYSLHLAGGQSLAQFECPGNPGCVDSVAISTEDYINWCEIMWRK